MWQRNKGEKESEVIQNKFTAYLATAVIHRRDEYITQLSKRQMEYLTDNDLQEDSYMLEDKVMKKLPFMMQLENAALFLALKKLNERERFILLERVLEEKSFEELASKVGLGYKGVASVYYRTLQKLKKFMEKDS